MSLLNLEKKNKKKIIYFIDINTTIQIIENESLKNCTFNTNNSHVIINTFNTSLNIFHV